MKTVIKFIFILFCFVTFTTGFANNGRYWYLFVPDNYTYSQWTNCAQVYVEKSGDFAGLDVTNFWFTRIQWSTTGWTNVPTYRSICIDYVPVNPGTQNTNPFVFTTEEFMSALSNRIGMAYTNCIAGYFVNDADASTNTGLLRVTNTIPLP